MRITSAREAESSARVRVAAGLAVLSLVVLAGCREITTSDFCHQFAQLEDKVAALDKVDAKTATAAELTSRGDQLQAELDQFQATTEGQLDTLVSGLRAAVRDQLEGAVASSQESLRAARPDIEDAVDDVRTAWAELQQRADVQCEQA